MNRFTDEEIDKIYDFFENDGQYPIGIMKGGTSFTLATGKLVGYDDNGEIEIFLL